MAVNLVVYTLVDHRPLSMFIVYCLTLFLNDIYINIINGGEHILLNEIRYL